MNTRVEPQKRIGVLLSLLGLLVMLMPMTAFAQSEDEDKVFVCKYVSTPGEDETLQTGNNPISISINAVPIYDPEDPAFDTAEDLVGKSFGDDQGRSIVIAVDVGQEEPDISECPAPGGPDTFDLEVVKAWGGDEFDDANLAVTLLIDGLEGPVEVEDGQTVNISESVTGLPEICTYESDAPASFTVDGADAVDGVITLTITNTVDCEDEVGGITVTTSTTSTTAPAVKVPTPTDEVAGTQVEAEELPFTGFDNELLVGMAVLLMTAGLVLLGVTAKREDA